MACIVYMRRPSRVGRALHAAAVAAAAVSGAVIGYRAATTSDTLLSMTGMMISAMMFLIAYIVSKIPYQEEMRICVDYHKGDTNG